MIIHTYVISLNMAFCNTAIFSPPSSLRPHSFVCVPASLASAFHRLYLGSGHFQFTPHSRSLLYHLTHSFSRWLQLTKTFPSQTNVPTLLVQKLPTGPICFLFSFFGFLFASIYCVPFLLMLKKQSSVSTSQQIPLW